MALRKPRNSGTQENNSKYCTVHNFVRYYDNYPLCSTEKYFLVHFDDDDTITIAQQKDLRGHKDATQGDKVMVKFGTKTYQGTVEAVGRCELNHHHEIPVYHASLLLPGTGVKSKLKRRLT